MAIHALSDPEPSSRLSRLLDADTLKTMEHLKRNLAVDFLHTYRNAIAAAHSLAQFVVWLSSPVVWKNAFSTWLMNLVASDVSVL